MANFTRRSFLASTGSLFLGSFFGEISEAKSEVKNKLTKSKNLIEDKTIYLTIDDGPRKYMRGILKTLGEHSKATFFCIGSQLNNPYGFDLAYRALSEGHSIGNHSYTHSKFSKINKNRVISEISRTHNILEKLYQKAGQKNPRLFRFPYGDVGGKNRRNISQILREFNYVPFGWDLDTEDWKYRIKEISRNKFISNLTHTKPNDVVLLHDFPLANSIINFYKSKKFMSKTLSSRTYISN